LKEVCHIPFVKKEPYYSQRFPLPNLAQKDEFRPPLLVTSCLLGRNENRDREMEEDKAEKEKEDGGVVVIKKWRGGVVRCVDGVSSKE
jgi:hypothetical protein